MTPPMGGPTAWPTPIAEAHAASAVAPLCGHSAGSALCTLGGNVAQAMPCTARSAMSISRLTEATAASWAAASTARPAATTRMGPSRSHSQPASGTNTAIATV